MKIQFEVPMHKKVDHKSERIWVTFDGKEVSGKLIFLGKHWWTPQSVLIPHTHSAYEFLYIVGGEGSIWSRGIECKLVAGDILVIEPYIEHEGIAHPENPFELFSIGYDLNRDSMQADPAVFGVDQVFRKLYEIYTNKTQLPVIKGNYQIGDMLFKLMDEINDSQLCREEIIRTYLTEILILLIRKVAEVLDTRNVNLNGKESVIEAKDFIGSHFHEPLALERIAKHVCLSPCHFSRLFKLETGLSPVEYLNHVRIAEAKRFLIYSDFTLTEIANRVGINSIHYFSHKFKKMEGVSPLEYRREKKRLLFQIPAQGSS